MDEKETPTLIPKETTLDEHFDDVIRMNASSAGRRLTEETPVITSVADQAENPISAGDNSAAAEAQDTTTGRRITAGGALRGGAAVGAIGLAILGWNAMEGGNDNGNERGEVITGVASIELNDDARFRNDPHVEDNDGSTNRVLELNTPVTIDINDDIRRLDNTNNGTWYGISTEDLAVQYPSVLSSGDKDGIVWVNEQGVDSIKTDLDEASEKLSEASLGDYSYEAENSQIDNGPHTEDKTDPENPTS